MANAELLQLIKLGVRAWNDFIEDEEKSEVTRLLSSLEDRSDQQPQIPFNLSRRTKDLTGADLSDMDLERVTFRHTDLSAANLSKTRFSGAHFSSVKLNRANLKGAKLWQARLQHVDLTCADCSDAVLYEADLRGCTFLNANLTRADFTDADLYEADLSGARLNRSSLRRTRINTATLRETDLTAARMSWTTFAQVDLTQAIGLDRIDHQAPCSIDVQSLVRSRQMIPGRFLRGIGLANSFIAYLNSPRSVTDFYSCFISYSSYDQEFADRLHADLQAQGVRCWFAPHHVQGGRKLHEQIDEAIKLHDRLLLILSPHSMASEWVMTEISKARKRELRDKTRVLFPISLAPFDAIRDWECFDADTGKDSAREIREYFIPDFSNCEEPDSYQKAFERLLKDLQAPPNWR